MDGYFAQDQLQEIWKQIGSLHLSYLELEESPQKLEQRGKLEEYIREFLCLAPHNNKFIFQEISEVLHRSASIKKDFSGYRAALGWNAIGMYAANLLNQPWRKEYKQIQLYSGFYKHQIDANLVGAEVIFEVMGYKRHGDGILVLDGPICPDRVISVSQDSIVAYVECQILKAIWEEVSINFKISWLEVLEFREMHLCSPKQSVQALNYRFHERQYQQHTRSFSQGTDPFVATSRLLGNAHQPSTLSAHSFPPLHSHPTISSTPCIYGTNNYYHNACQTYAPVNPQHYPCHVPLNCSPTLPKTVYHSSNYCHNGYIVPPPPPPYMCQRIPTAQLIELESQSSHHYDTVDIGHSHPRNDILHTSCGFKNDLKNFSDKETENNMDTIDNWDFVYRDLENQGYSKDLGERGDVLTTSNSEVKRPKSTIRDTKKSTKSNILENSINNLSLNEEVIRTNENLQKFKDRERDPVPSKFSNEREPANSQKMVRHTINGYVKSSNISEKATIANTVIDNNRPSNSRTLDVRKQKQNQSNDKIVSLNQNTKEVLNNDNLDKWQCDTCTFLNPFSQRICEMCGKSRIKIQDDMEIGGAQCSKCTLVNPKDNKVCSACSSSLKDSPTYI